MEVDSDTEAVATKGFKLGCISCKMRGEVPAIAWVNWYFRASDETEFYHVSASKEKRKKNMRNSYKWPDAGNQSAQILS